MVETIVTGSVIVTVFALFLGFILTMRYMSYKETIELARQGVYRQGRSSNRSRAMRWGVIVTALGTALTCGLFTIGLEADSTLVGPWLLGGMLPLSLGISLLIIGRMNNQSADVIIPPAEPEITLPDFDDPIPPHKSVH